MQRTFRLMVLYVVAALGAVSFILFETSNAVGAAQKLSYKIAVDSDAGHETAISSLKPPQIDKSTKTKSIRAAKPRSSVLDKTHEQFSSELGKYVHNGLVDYQRWQRETKPLDDYLAALSKISADEYGKLSHNEKMALWINAYNAFTIKQVLDHYPITGTKTYYPPDSIRQVDGFWEDDYIELCGRKVNLDNMEHNILRREFLDPRTHFAVVCAAKGCAELKSNAYTAANLDEELNQATLRFLSNQDNVRFDKGKGTLTVSMLFKWFPLDFAHEVGLGKRFPPPTDDEIVCTYIMSRAPDTVRNQMSANELKNYKVIYKDYDWSLNDSAAKSVSPSPNPTATQTPK